MEKYIKTHDVRTFDFNMYDEFTVYGCLNYFQDAARLHATLLDVGYDQMINQNYIWVLMKTKYEIYQNPKPESEIKVITWPSGQGRADFIRDYEIRDLDDNLLIKGASQWVVVDKTTRRIVKANAVNFPYQDLEENYIKDKFEKVEIYNLNEYTHKYEYKTVNFDLDHYMHVNNSSYARILFDGLDLEYQKNIIGFEINYLHETKLNENITIYYKFNDKIISGLIVSDDVNKVTFKIKYE